MPDADTAADDRSPAQRPPVESLRTLCKGLVDYAGLFPPAKLDMKPAVENFGRYTQGRHTWMLGRYVCPASRLPEFVEHARVMLPGTWATSGYREMATDAEPWRLTCVIDGDPLEVLEDRLQTILRFNDEHASEDNGLAVVDAIELKAADPGVIDDTIESVPESIHPYYEVPVRDGSGEALDIRGFIAAIAGNEASAKIRCGGVEPGMIPPAEIVAGFIHACHAAGVNFKATAGLHHPVRGEQPLTYDEQPPRAVMHGFLNVFLASAGVKAGELGDVETLQLLNETEPAAFRFDERGVSWVQGTGEGDREGGAERLRLNLEQLAKGRRFAVGFGSCSFEEPVDDLRSLGLL